MIRSFADSRTAAIHAGAMPKGVARDLARRARAKLLVIDAAESLVELASPPGNRLEKLGGGRAGQWSIRVGGQWRICFRWLDGHALDVWFGDYH